MGGQLKFTRILSVLKRRPFDTSTESGRSQERYRRALLTTISAGFAKALSLLISLVTVPLTFHYLGAERYGLWMVLISFISVMSFADLGIGNGLINTISEAHGKDDRNLARVYVTSAAAMLSAIAAILAVAGSVAYFFLPWNRLFNVQSPSVAAEGARAFCVLFAWFVLNIPLGVVSRIQSGLQQGYFPQIIGAAGSFVSLLALLIVIKVHGSLALLVFGSTVGSIAATAVNGWLLFREHRWLLPKRHSYSMEAARKTLNLGFMFFILQCAFAIAFTSDNIVIAQVLGAAAVAAYAVPQKLFSSISMIVTMAINPLWPAYGEAIARGDAGWVRRTFYRSLWLTLAITLPACSFLALAGRWILQAFFGKSLQASIGLLVVLAVWTVINSISVVVSVFLNGAGVLKAQTVVATISSLSNLALSIIFTRRFGVMGVCLGSIAAQTFIMLPACFIFIRGQFNIWKSSATARPEGTAEVLHVETHQVDEIPHFEA